MRKISLLLLMTICLPLATWAAGSGPYSLGGMIGDPTGFSFKYDFRKDEVIDGGIGWSLGARSGFAVHSDYLWLRPGQVSAGDAELDLYYGVGGRLISVSGGGDNGKIALGPRLPVGLLHHLADPNVEFFGELALVLDIIPSTSLDLDLAAGIRYRF